MGSQKPRRFTSTVLAVMIVFSALTVLNFTSMNVLATDYEIYSDLIIDRAIWNESDTITLNECNLIIENGGILTYNNSVNLIIKNDYAGHYGITIEAGGQFIINSPSGNTKIVNDVISNPSRTYSFTNSGTIDFLGATVQRVYGDPDNSKMGGIVNNPGSVCELENCKLYDSDTHGICVDNSNLTLKGSSTQICPDGAFENDGSGIWIKGNSNVSIEQITINNTQEYGIKCVDVDNVTIKNEVEINNAGSYGIYLNNANAVIKNCSVNNNSESGIFLDGSIVKSGRIENNKIVSFSNISN